MLAATISAVGHLPVAGLALILGIDRFMSEARALTNLVGNGVATIVVAKSVKELDHKKLNDTLNNRTSEDKTFSRTRCLIGRFSSSSLSAHVARHSL